MCENISKNKLQVLGIRSELLFADLLVSNLSLSISCFFVLFLPVGAKRWSAGRSWWDVNGGTWGGAGFL